MTKRLIFIFSVLLPFLCTFSSAQIIISNVSQTYSFGDNLNIKLDVIETKSIEGVISLILDCDSYKIPFFATSTQLEANKIKSFDIQPLKLMSEGNCSIRAELKSFNEIIDSSETSPFSISDDININVQINKKYFSPGETIEIIGTAEKANEAPFIGFGTITFNDKKYTLNIKGRFSAKIEIEKDISSGIHSLIIFMKDDYNNSGMVEKEISINAIPTSIKIDLDKESYYPSDILSASITLNDQADEKINESISVTLYNPWGIDILSKAIIDEKFEFKFSADSMPGNWWIYAFSNGIKERKFFYVKEVESIDVNIINQTLTIKNTGNKAYQKPIQVIFNAENNSEVQIISLDIPVNKQETYKLDAPDGEYNVTIKSDNFEKSFSVILTGKAIAIKTNSLKNKAREIVVIAFVILVILFSILARYKINSNKIKVKLAARE